MTLTCCQDHILTENIWFVWSETSYSGDERRCHRCGTTERTNEQTLKIELLSQWKLEAEFRKNSTCVKFCQHQLEIMFWMFANRNATGFCEMWNPSGEFPIQRRCSCRLILASSSALAPAGGSLWWRGWRQYIAMIMTMKMRTMHCIWWHCIVGIGTILSLIHISEPTRPY